MIAKSYDFIVVGAGIVGLTLARELASRKVGRILVLEKEPEPGRHASGRNSGVVHAGIYYAADSLKAKFCVEGAKRLTHYAGENNLPILKCGKVIVANREDSVPGLSVLLERAEKNNVDVKKISLEELREIEPEAHSFEYALWSPQTSVVDSKAILNQLIDDLKTLGVKFAFNCEVHSVNSASKTVFAGTGTFNFGFLFNTAGVYADRIAKHFGVGSKYRILPFKGLYWKSSNDYAKRIQRLIYPVPNIGMPFLGVHITRTVDGKVLFGPTAIPAFGRENYSMFGGLSPRESPAISWHLLRMLIRNPGHFRTYVREEMGRYWPSNFFNEAKTLVQTLSRQDIGEFYKVGIRAQLMDVENGRLEMDFVIEAGENSLHVLNAISPAFTCAFAFAPYLVDRALKGKSPQTDTSKKLLGESHV